MGVGVEGGGGAILGRGDVEGLWAKRVPPPGNFRMLMLSEGIS